MQHVGKGEFVVNVRPWLPERLRNVVFRDQYVVALVGGGGDEDVSNVETGFAEMIGVVRNMKQKGLSKLEVEKIYAETLEEVYEELEKGVVDEGVREIEEGGADGPNEEKNQEEASHVAPRTPVKKKRMTMPIRKTPPREAKCSDRSPKRHAGVRGLLVKCTPTNKKIVGDKNMGTFVWGCKHAFSGKHECTVAYCDDCRNQLCTEQERRGRGSRGKRGGGGAETIELAQ